MEMSSGTLYPLSCNARIAPIAIGSLAANIAVGKLPLSIISHIALCADEILNSVIPIVDRTSSSRFLSLDGVWQIEQHDHIDDFDVNEKLSKTIPVPSCVQMHGYDHIQYLNTRYPFPVMLPHIPYENPCWHYRRTFNLKKQDNERYYINFEGVDLPEKYEIPREGKNTFRFKF